MKRAKQLKYQATAKGKACRQRWYLKHVEERRLKAKCYRDANPDKRRQWRRKQRIVDGLRRRVYKALKGTNKSARTIELLGCSIENFLIYIESKFEPGMSWDNYGYRGWHIDHIIPCALFDLSRREHQRRCFHFSNMQPMFAAQNMKKSNRPTTQQFNLL